MRGEWNELWRVLKVHGIRRKQLELELRGARLGTELRTGKEWVELNV